MHGIKITAPNPSIGPFHSKVDESLPDGYSKNININNVYIENIIGCIDEELICTTNGNVVHICAGLKAAHTLINNNVAKKLINTIYELIKDDEHIAKIIKSNINQDSLDFINHGLNRNNNCGFIGGMDVMAHINKGIHGIRLGSCSGVSINNCKVKNITNQGKPVDNSVIEEIKVKFQGVDEIVVADTTFLSPITYVGSYAMGSIISGCKNVTHNNVNISNIRAPFWCAVGTAINNICDCIDIIDTNICNLESCSDCYDSTTLVVDEQSKKVTINNTSVN